MVNPTYTYDPPGTGIGGAAQVYCNIHWTEIK